MKILFKTMMAILLITLFSVPAFTQEARFMELNERAVKFYQQGRYSEGVQVAEEALKVVEKTFGPEHPNVTTVLRNMAECYKKTGKKNEAEKLEERASACG